MTTDEFKTIMPGILPDVIEYNKQLYLKEKFDSITEVGRFLLLIMFFLLLIITG